VNKTDAQREGDTNGGRSRKQDRVRFLVGFDVGSTTVKAVAVESASGRIVWRDYRRHDTRQAEMLLEFLGRLEGEAGVAAGNSRVFITGTGGGKLAAPIGARFVQEVNAVALAVEKLHPEVHSVIELGGQDAKILVFKQDGLGRRKKFASMNDKCAGGTGAVIDKIAAKLGISADCLQSQGYRGIPIHPVAGKCGVFAETDINSLQKLGVPAGELMASLFDAIVLQNLTVLARGHTLASEVLLLGGPNAFIPGMREAWQHKIPQLWQERGVKLPDGAAAEDLIRVPEDALYYGALGAIEFGRTEDVTSGLYTGLGGLENLIGAHRGQGFEDAGGQGLCASDEERREFERRYQRPTFQPPEFHKGERVEAFLGIDGGSTSTKAVLLSTRGELLAKAYQLSKGNPIQDTIEVLARLRAQVEEDGAHLAILGVGTTGYAKDVLRQVLQADVAVVETVAHAESAKHFFADPHVIVDVGGQDIKIILLRDGAVRDFKLNTQCSAGNGYFLQSTAEGLGISVENYADAAFSARAMPTFGYGCAVFLQSDIVNFQRQGWRAHEILAGLATVLPRNVFLHVAKVPNLPALGTRYVLQGGTQNNLAAVKAEVDFLGATFRHSGVEPEIRIHPHCGESGAIGAALEAMRTRRAERATTFIGMDAVATIRYSTRCDEQTRCSYCTNACLRTFLSVAGTNAAAPSESRRIVLANCEKGAAEDVDELRGIQARLEAIKAANPNLVAVAAREAFRARRPELVADPVPRRAWNQQGRQRLALRRNRGRVRIGIPRVLSMYAYAPLFSAYLESLGVAAENIVYSSVTSGEMYRSGSSRGSIDPCYPSKIAIAHVHDLLFKQHPRTPLDLILFPMFDVLATRLANTRANNGCPTASITPETVEAAFTKETDLFRERGIRYIHPLVNLSNRRLLARQLHAALDPALGLSEDENARAVEAGFRELERFEADLRRRGREVLDKVEQEGRLAIVLLGRPYHHDPGINHGIMEEIQKLGYPILSQSTLPMDGDLLERLFGEEIRAGTISSALAISDVWKTAFSANSNQKLWAAKFVARHPNLVAVEFSSFKCGHDAPIYSVVEQIMQCSGTPYFGFKDMDENRPANSIKLRIETMDYFLKRYRQERFGTGVEWAAEEEIDVAVC
jgi:predicted CoA-substrate-specific enzyme activase